MFNIKYRKRKNVMKQINALFTRESRQRINNNILLYENILNIY